MNATLSNLLQKRIVVIVLLCVVLATIGAGAFLGLRYYQYRQSADYACDKLRTALQKADVDALAKMVDFNNISARLAHETAVVFPFFHAGHNQERELNKLIQTNILKILKTQPTVEKNEDLSPSQFLEKPLIVLPGNIVPQIVETLTVRSTEANTAVVTATVEHPQFKRKFALLFNMIKGKDGWFIQNLLNAKELVESFNKATIARLTERHNTRRLHNAGMLKSMNSILELQSCTAGATVLSGQKSVLVVVHVLARNKSNKTVNNMNIATVISTRNGEEVLKHNFNAVHPTEPGNDFSQRWSLELDRQSAEAQKILTGSPLTCKAAWRTLGVSNGQVLHIDDEILDLQDCSIPGHKHPAGLCEEAIFK